MRICITVICATVFLMCALGSMMSSSQERLEHTTLQIAIGQTLQNALLQRPYDLYNPSATQT